MKQIKFYAIVILLIVLVIPSVALAAWRNPFTWNWNIFGWFSKPQTNIVQQNNDSGQNTNSDRATITNNLMKSYLETYKSSSVDLNNRIKDYSINNVFVEITKKNCFSSTVKFSVDTYRSQNNNWTNWSAGNGVIDGDWVRNKSEVVNVVEDKNGNYTIKIVGTARVNDDCATGSAVTSTQPSITIVSPNGGESWKVGETHNITWNATGVQTVNISINAGASGAITVASNVSASSGSYSWTIPANIFSGNWKVIINSGSVVGYSSNTFSIGTPSAATPFIASISPNPAKIGQATTVTGANLNGFEGDKNLWIENSAGQKGVIYGDRSGAGDTIKFTLASSYCTADNSYSGLPCPAYIMITPGAYSIYATPWGTTSNKVTFNIVK